MKYLKTYESLNNPQIGDYVICKDNQLSKKISSMIGQIVDKESDDFKESYSSFYNAGYDFLVLYKQIPEEFEYNFHKCKMGYVRPFFKTEIKFSAKTIEELELYINAKKYNL